MSIKFSKLLKEIHYARLSDVATIVRGDRITKKDIIADGRYLVISGGTQPMGRYVRKNRPANTITISSYGSAGFVDFITEDFWANDICLSVFPDLMRVDNKFLYYALKSQQAYIYGNTTKAIPDHIPTQFLNDLKIPVPPLPVQREVVRILDTFTAMNANLEEELAARRKQFDFYLNNITTDYEKGSLCLNSSVQWLPLNKIATSFRGEYITKKDSHPGVIPVILGGQEPAYYIDKFNHEGEIVCVSRSGMSAGFVSYWNEPIFLTDGFGYEAIDEISISRYLFFIMKNRESEMCAMKRGAGVPHVSGESIGNLLFPVPPLPVQRKIVRDLDAFTGVIANIQTELALRRKQYEYYRDKLLAFKEA